MTTNLTDYVIERVVDGVVHKNHIFSRQFPRFKPSGRFSQQTLLTCFDFAFVQAIKSFHREYRSGGAIRTNLALFLDTLSGKLGEVAVAKMLDRLGVPHTAPCFEHWERGKWDPGYDIAILYAWPTDSSQSYGFAPNEIRAKLEVKSLPCYGGLLMLETEKRQEWEKADIVVAVRLKPKLSDLSGRLPSEVAEDKRGAFWAKIVEASIEAQVNGFATRTMIADTIANGRILHKGEIIGYHGIVMDVDNYFIELLDLKPFGEILGAIPVAQRTVSVVDSSR